MKNRRKRDPHQLHVIAAAVAACFSSHLALANPTGPTVANGQVTFHQQGNLLQITNSPNAIINWQSFSIGSSEITRFLQQSASSAVLNRVITQNPSSILGMLQSNGRVFLINPNGILFGPGSRIDVAGLVASTLNLSDMDFLAGRLRFAEMPGAGSVINQGAINAASGGQVYLVGPAVRNEGVITSPKGEVILAAGNSVELVTPGTPNLRVEITAPDNEAVNLGQIAADAGRVGIYAGLITQSGTVQANTAQVTEDGRIVLSATKGVNLETGSVTAASGVKGGNVTVETTTGPIYVAGRIDADALTMNAQGNIVIRGDVSSGPQTINAGGGLTVMSGSTGPALLNASGGQSINARSIEVTAQDLQPALISNFASGDQVIIVAGSGSSPGIDVQSLSSGGVASIGNFAAGAAQTIIVTDADHINVNGFGPNSVNVSASIEASTGTQTISIAGNGANAINVGSVGAVGGSIINARSQNITAGANGQSGSITIIGPDVDSASAVLSTQGGLPGTQTVSTSGALTITGGNAGQAFASGLGHNASGPQTVSAASIALEGGSNGRGNGAEIRSQTGDQVITVTGGGTLSLQGGGGTDNFARIRTNTGNQQINVAGGAIMITGGNGPDVPFPTDTANNFARIESRAPGGVQTVIANTITLTGGAAGENNFSGLQAANQFITTSGNVTLQGGAGTGSSGARLGGTADVTATNAVLNVGGQLTLRGGAGSGAVIGSNDDGGLPTNVVVNAVSDITLNPGTGAGARIGSPSANVAGGNILLTSTGGNIALNSANGIGTAIRTQGDVTLNATGPIPMGRITQGANSGIEANHLMTASSSGTNLGGNNQVTFFNATNTFDGDIVLNNTSQLLTVTGIQFGAGLPPPLPPLGALTLNQNGDLTLTGNIVSGLQTISATGDILVVPSSPTFVHAFGPQAINASGGLILQSSPAGFAQVSSDGGQTINAAFVEVTAQGNDASIINFGSGSQAVTTTGINSSGEGLTVRSFGGPGTFARISQVGTGEQTIIVRNADRVSVNGIDGFALIGAELQSISVTGAASTNAINLGGPGALGSSQIFGGTQSITAGLTGQAGSITIYGSDAPNEQAIIVSGQGGGSQTVSTSGTLTVNSGTSPFGGFSSGFFANGTGGQNIKAQRIVLQGGSSGAGNSAVIRNNAGDQHISAPGGAIVVAGGSSTGGLPQLGNNFARIENRSLSGVQTVESDTITITGGPNGESNFAGIQAAHQLITTTGDVTLVGGGGSVTGARIGAVGSTSPTDLKLNVGGKLTLTGGTETDASLGANRDGGQQTDLTVTVAGDITLNPGTNPGANARIGSPAVNVAGGNILLTSTGGNIALNSVPGIGTSIRTLGNVTLRGNAITQGDESAIQADRLTTVSNAGTSLNGKNQVAAFDATNGASGGVWLRNASPALTVTGVSTIPGPFTLMQDGDLAIVGHVWSGPQTIAVSGDMTVGADSKSVILYAAGPRSGGATSVPLASWNALGTGLLDLLAGHSPVNISARSLSVRGGSQFGSFVAITGGPINITTQNDFSLAGGRGFGAFGWVLSTKDINLDIGGNVRLDAGTGLLSFARMQTVHPTSKIKIYFPNLSSGGYFVNGVEGAYRDGLSGFYAGLLPAKPGMQLVTTYGQ